MYYTYTYCTSQKDDVTHLIVTLVRCSFPYYGHNESLGHM